MSPAARRPQSPPPPPRARWVAGLALMLAAFAAATLVAELAGAPNLGTALTFGQIAFALAAVFVLLRR
jgi:hypothetical protein